MAALVAAIHVFGFDRIQADSAHSRASGKPEASIWVPAFAGTSGENGASQNGTTGPRPGPPRRRLACQSRGCPLSRWPGFAAIAQPVEHIIRNDGVGGSNPSCGTRT
jgi:hypothetical protein